MRTRIGIAVAHECVRALVLRRGKIIWAGETCLENQASLSDELGKLLRSAPMSRVSRPLVFAAIGPEFAQVRTVAGLPPVTDSHALSRIITESSGRFFLKGPTPLLISGVRPIANGKALAAAFDEPTIRHVVDGCQVAGLRLHSIAPTVAVLGTVLEGAEITWHDHTIHVHGTYADGRLASARRLAGFEALPTADCLRPRPVLARMGEQAVRFADAAGAALLHADEAIVLRPGKALRPLRDVPAWRMAAAATAFAVTAAAALLAPGYAASRASGAAEVRLAALADVRQAAVTARAELQQFTNALDVVSHFDAKRRSVTLLLAELAQALPERTALLMMRMDSIGGTIVALTPDGAQVVGALESMQPFTNTEIVGPVTSEAVGATVMERITIRFRFAVTHEATDQTNTAAKQ